MQSIIDLPYSTTNFHMVCEEVVKPGIWTYLQRNMTREARKGALKDGESIPSPFTAIPCEYHRLSDSIPIKLYAGSLSYKHDLRWADRDKKVTAREVYEDDPGFPVKSLATHCGITNAAEKQARCAFPV